MGLYAADGSWNIALDTGTDTNEDYADGKGIYSKSGGYRINTTDSGPGIYAADGAFRGSVSDDESTPALGRGVYTPDGAWRLTITGSTLFGSKGIYAIDGSFRGTVTNAS